MNRLGARRTFAAPLVVFTAASALCVAAPDLALSTAARAVQGLGGALMVPVGRLVVLRGVRRDQVLCAVG